MRAVLVAGCFALSIAVAAGRAVRPPCSVASSATTTRIDPARPSVAGRPTRSTQANEEKLAA